VRRALRHALHLAAGLALIAGSGAAQAQGRGTSPGAEVGDPAPEKDEDVSLADPREVVAAERAFARAAQEKGQWTAYAEFAADDAIMFAPQPVKAQDWLSGRADPPQAVRWQTHEVWSSCDGSLAVTRGAWQQADGSVGYFTTVWHQQGNGEYRWALDQSDTLQEPLARPDKITTVVATCPWAVRTSGLNEADLANLDAEALRGGASNAGSGWSADGTLAYRYSVEPSGAREFVVFLLTDRGMQEVVHSEVAAP
jgi:ketosteroid isomerase-like protein